MRALSPETRKIADAVRKSFFDFIAKRQAAFPTVLRRMAADPWRAVVLLRAAAWLSLKQIRVRDARFIFLSCRHADLLGRLAGTETAVVGTLKEFVFSRRLGITFCFSGDLFLAAHAILFGRGGIPIERIVQRWKVLFLRQQDPCYLVLPDDTSPISLLLAKIASECPNMRSVCIQHGLFNKGSDLDDIEGRNSQINLVYDAQQKVEMLRRLPGAAVEVMGFPADLPVAHQAAEGQLQVVLIGTGATEQPDVLAKSVIIFREVARVLSSKHSRISYRPHPAEIRSNQLPDCVLPMNLQSKEDLLSGTRKLFIGFNSTLLYEAFLSGHVVVVLDDEALRGYSICRFGLRQKVSELWDLARLIDEQEGLASIQSDVGGNVLMRFSSALERAESHIRREF